ncbi:Alpha/beta hydrolase family [Moraxella lacunata]|uniref:Alpha/beta hydrolase family n=1 Tax=Moraxella lacunata TaxID=477 RepID=A0A378T4P9_MORLA|nr:alpha/beta fold hydrolase [Moraxella lacunata]STZ55791.1 Alpha/beta hydrolase family [Moraxella lacunata]
MANKPTTLVLHGLHQTSLIVYPLARYIRRAGFVVHTPTYHSLRQDVSAHAKRLNDYLLTHHSPDKPINLVAHSLGGLVIRQFLHDYPAWQVHRCVSLGTPHQGSVCATYVKRTLSPLVGQSYIGALDGTCPSVPNDVEFGVIAGDKSQGLGLLFLNYHNRHYRTRHAHDGTVFVHETELPSATDSLILPVTHTGMLTSSAVANQVVHFLEYGKFRRA